MTRHCHPLLALAALTLAAACAHTNVPQDPPPPPAGPPRVVMAAPTHEVSAAAMQDPIGTSTESAVPVPVQGDEVAFENNWMYDRFGRFRRQKYAAAHQGDRHYDIITIELPDHSTHTVYFDITDLWAEWGKQGKQPGK
jgi:hypothetical protein